MSNHPKGSILPLHHVNCMDCSAPLALKSYWRKPRCKECRARNRAGANARSYRELRRLARRYRILIHHLGWEDDQFEEMLEEIKRSPMAFRYSAETRAAKVDRTNEKSHVRRLAEASHPRGARDGHRCDPVQVGNALPRAGG